MNSRTRSIVMSNVKMLCPLCTDYFRTKNNLRKHLGMEHTDREGEEYIGTWDK